MMMEMTEEMEAEALPDEEIPDGPDTNGNDDGNTEEEIIDGSIDTDDGTENTDTESFETEDGLPEDETDADGTDIPVESLNVTGSILIPPEGYELNFEESGLDGDMETGTGTDENAVLSSEQFGQISEQLEQVTEAVTVQNDILYGGIGFIVLMFGAVFGVLLIHGFRLRRV